MNESREGTFSSVSSDVEGSCWGCFRPKGEDECAMCPAVEGRFCITGEDEPLEAGNIILESFTVLARMSS
jgi:hypothetical protein